MSIVSIHQPNYFPWLGYFYKIANSDVFVFLDDAQFSKNSYTNRVQILGKDEKIKWLTVPVSVHLGQSINEVNPSLPDWKSRHLDSLFGHYSCANSFEYVWPDIQEMFNSIDSFAGISQINSMLVIKISNLLGIQSDFRYSSELNVKGKGEKRLISIVSSISSKALYLSGVGGKEYQNPKSFIHAGLGFKYTNFSHPHYNQWSSSFQTGLSILDPIFHLGWKKTALLLSSQLNKR
jgi:hypothetical protein